MGKKAKVAVIKASAPVGEPKPEDSAHRRALINFEKRKLRTGWALEFRLAGDNYCMRNAKLPATVMPSYEPFRFQFCDFFFPYAEGGPLFIDRARDKFDEQKLSEKAALLEGTKVRYLAIPLKFEEEELMVRMEGMTHGMEHSEART